MAANTVEATLISKYEDRVSRGIQQTESLMNSVFANMKNAGAAFGGGMDQVWNTALGGLETWRQRLRQAAEESDSSFGKFGLGAAAVSVLIVGAFLKASKAVGDFLFDLAKESSRALEARMAFESLTGAMNIQADVLQGKLKTATSGLISGTVLLQDANRVLQSHVPITSDQYVKLTENVFRLAKAAGVDTTQAINTLTDSIIRGNARGFQSIGIHIAVKDAVSSMAEAMGESTGKLGDDARMRAFYNELLKKTGEGASALGPEFLTVEDLLKQGQNTWNGFLSSLGQAIGRSGVLQELMKKLNGELLTTGASKEQMSQLTLAVNGFIIAFLKGLSDLAIILGATVTVWNAFWATLKVAFLTGSSVVILGIGSMHEVLLRFVQMLAMIPGAEKLGLRSLADDMQATADVFREALASNVKDIAHAYDGLTNTEDKLDKFAMATAGVAGELEAFSGTVLRGGGAVTHFGNGARITAEMLKELNDQLKKYQELRKELAGRYATPENQALNQLVEDYQKIEALTLVSEEKRNHLKVLALMAFDQKEAEVKAKRAAEDQKLTDEADKIAAEVEKHRQKEILDTAVLDEATGEAARRREEWWTEFCAQKAKEREEARRKEVQDTLTAASAIQRALDLASHGKVSQDVGSAALAQLPAVIEKVQREIKTLEAMKILDDKQIEEVVRLKTKLEELNKIKFTPFQQALAAMKQEGTSF